MKVVLGCAPEHGRAADVDLLNGLLPCNIGTGNGLYKGVEVNDHQVDRLEIMFLHRCEVSLIVTTMKDAGMNLGMQGLHPAIEHLGKPGKMVNLLDLDAGLREGAGSSPR